MELSVTQVMSFYIFFGSVLYFLLKLPSVLPVFNVILSIVYGLFVFNIIQFQTSRDTLLLGTLLIIMALSFFQILRTDKKYALVGALFQFIGSLTAFLIYTGLIKHIKFLKKILTQL
jgi:hypothetical protein